MFKRFVGIALAAATFASLLAVGSAQAVESATSASAPTRQTSADSELDPMFIGQRRPSYNLAQLKPLTKPVQLFENTHLQSMAVIGRTIIAAGLYVDTSNVAITLINPAGRRVGWMRLLGVGHGTSIAARVHMGRIVLWIEADSDRPDGYGRGRTLARVVFRNGATYSTRMLERMRPGPGSTQVNPTIDLATHTLAVRFREGAATYLDRYNLTAASNGKYIKVSRSVVPLPCDERIGVIQGWAISGNFVYCVQGGTGQRTYVGWKNWHTFAARRYLVNFAAPNRSREAEGMTTAHYQGRNRVMLGLALLYGSARYAVVLTST